MKYIYLDYAAATPVDPTVLAAMQPFFSDKFHNPSAIYLAGQQARRAMEDARADIAAWLGAKPAEVIFTAGATEANNLAITGLMRQFPDAELLVSSVEHDSVLAPASQFANHKIPVSPAGITDVSQLEKMINKKTLLVSIMLVNNELGTIQPLKDIGRMIKKVRSERQQSGDKLPIYLHSDVAQAANLIDIHTSRLGVDLVSLNGGKIYGPKQSGALFVRAGIRLQPLILGGGQESGLRSGTENVPATVGLAAALVLAQKQHVKENKRLKELRDLFIQQLNGKMPKVQVNGSLKHQSPHILSLSFPGFDNERLMIELDERGIQTAVGSACSASSDKPSHVLEAIGLSHEMARSSLRFSFGRQTTKEDIIKTMQALMFLTDSHT